MIDTFHIINPGVMTTVQDLGRTGYGQYGIPVSGAMDRYSFQIANRLVGNDPGDAGLEVTIFGLKLETLRSVRISITGGDMNPILNGQPAPMWQSLDLPSGSMLLFKNIRKGARAYLAVEGGIDSPLQFDSRSTHQRALLGRTLKKGDIIKTFPVKRTLSVRRVPESHLPSFLKQAAIRVILGPQDDLFSKKGMDTFLSETYTITSQSDRQGYRLEGGPIEHASGADIISDAVLPGSIQVPGNKQPIIMMMDTQTTGGYPKIACVIGPDIDVLAQMMPGHKVRFQQITIEEAHKIVHAQALRLRQLEKEIHAP
jgi:antagonist of KipI